MRIAVIGDTHGKDLLKIENVIENDLIIVLGDFGFYGKNLSKLNKLLEDNRKTILFIPGNHEKYNKIKRCKHTEMFGDRVTVYSKNILMLETGRAYNIMDKTFLVFGGAKSIDRHVRTDNLDWFECEEYSEYDKEILSNTLINNDYTFDYILTHDCPTTVCKLLHKREYRETSRTASILENIANITKYEEWLFGHHHMDISYGRYKCLYDEPYIIELS